MSASLNEEFNLWLGRLAMEWAIPKTQLATHLGNDEISDRIRCYPAFGRALTQVPVDMAEVEETGKVCWALGERFDAIRSIFKISYFGGNYDFQIFVFSDRFLFLFLHLGNAGADFLGHALSLSG